MARSKSIDEYNTGEHIHDIISRTVCVKHNAQRGVPCFKIYYDSILDTNSGRSSYGFAICNTRVIAAGFNGTISPNSLSRTGKPR